MSQVGGDDPKSGRSGRRYLITHLHPATMSAHGEPDAMFTDLDPIWTTCRSARQIYALGLVDKAGDQVFR